MYHLLAIVLTILFRPLAAMPVVEPIADDPAFPLEFLGCLTTHACCQGHYYMFLPVVEGDSQLPRVLSSATTSWPLENARFIQYKCFDTLPLAILQSRGEVQERGPYRLRCPPGYRIKLVPFELHYPAENKQRFNNGVCVLIEVKKKSFLRKERTNSIDSKPSADDKLPMGPQIWVASPPNADKKNYYDRPSTSDKGQASQMAQLLGDVHAIRVVSKDVIGGWQCLDFPSSRVV